MAVEGIRNIDPYNHLFGLLETVQGSGNADLVIQKVERLQRELLALDCPVQPGLEDLCISLRCFATDLKKHKLSLGRCALVAEIIDRLVRSKDLLSARDAAIVENLEAHVCHRICYLIVKGPGNRVEPFLTRLRAAEQRSSKIYWAVSCLNETLQWMKYCRNHDSFTPILIECLDVLKEMNRSLLPGEKEVVFKAVDELDDPLPYIKLIL